MYKKVADMTYDYSTGDYSKHVDSKGKVVTYKKFCSPEPKKVVRAYTKKAIVCNNVIEIIAYEEPVYEGFESVVRGKQGGKKLKRKDSLNKTKNNIRRLINCNLEPNSTFATFTYAENMTDINQGKNDFKNFIKRWNYQRKKQELDALKYVYVVEFQKRGAVHFHCIFLNSGYIKNKELKELWRHGHVKINKIKDVDNVGAYVVKYMAKDVLDDRLLGKDLYGRSKGNLREPYIIKDPQELAALEDKIKNYCVYDKQFASEYHGSVQYKQYNTKR